MTTAFNSIQKTYALSTLAGTPSDQHGTVAQLEAYASKVINATLKDTTAQGLIGQWDLVWGPAVYQTPGSDVADNAFYIAQNNSSPNEFVIAISGTNPISRYGIDRLSLTNSGIPNDLVDRVFRALFVYSVGFYELIKKCLQHCDKRYSIITNIWKVFSILLEYTRY